VSRVSQFDFAFANPRGREGIFGAALVLLLLAACTRDPPANTVGKSRAELGIEATQPRQAWFPAQDFPVQQFGGAVVAQGDHFTGFWPGTRNPGPRGFFFTTLFADGGLAPVGFATPNDFEQAQLTITPLDDSRSVLTSSWGELIVLGLVDARGLIGSTLSVRAAQPFRVVSHRGALQLAASVYNDAGYASVTAIDIEDGGLSVRPTRFFSVGSTPVDFAISGDSLAVSTSGTFTTPPQVSLFNASTLTLLATVPLSASPVSEVRLIPEQGGFRVVWVNSPALLQRRLSEAGAWLEPAPSSFSPGANAHSLGAWARDADGGVVMTWTENSTAFAGPPGGPHFSLGSIRLGELACGSLECVMLDVPAAVLFRPRGPAGVRFVSMLRKTPDMQPIGFGWSRRLWAIGREGTAGGSNRQRVFRVDLDGGFSPTGLDLGALDFIDVVGTETDSAAVLERRSPGLALRILTERDGGLVLSGSRMVTNTGVHGRLFAHDHHYLVTWENQFYAVMDATGSVLTSGSLPRYQATGTWVATPPGEFWVTYDWNFSSQFEALRVSLTDGGTTVETIPGRALVTTPDAVYFESSQGFVRRFHDGGWAAPFMPYRGGPALWTGTEIQVFPGPSRVRLPEVADSTLAAIPPLGVPQRAVTDRQGNVLLTWFDFVTDAVDGRQRVVPMSQVLRTVIRQPGQSCQLASDCTTSFCADGVCCDSACGGSNPSDCMACSVDAGAPANGHCVPAVATLICRDARDVCDEPERCDAISLACPADRLVDAGTLCRTAQSQCDLDARCDGQTVSCPFPARDAGTPCDDGSECTTNDVCSGFPGNRECWGSPRTGACDDGDLCTSGDLCFSGECQRGQWCVPAECQVPVACGTTGCQFAPEVDGVPCDGGTCSAGACLGMTLDGGSVDAGLPVDAGREADAGSDAGAFDAGNAADAGFDAGAFDAGNAVDAGSDAGREVDAGTVDAGSDAGREVDAGAFDAGSAVDAGSDAGREVDAGNAVDAGPDGGQQVDAGAGDAGTTDAGRPDASDGESAGTPEPQGCGCNASGALQLIALLFFAGGRARARRRQLPTRSS